MPPGCGNINARISVTVQPYLDLTYHGPCWRWPIAQSLEPIDFPIRGWMVPGEWFVVLFSPGISFTRPIDFSEMLTILLGSRRGRKQCVQEICHLNVFVPMDIRPRANCFRKDGETNDSKVRSPESSVGVSPRPSG